MHVQKVDDCPLLPTTGGSTPLSLSTVDNMVRAQMEQLQTSHPNPNRGSTTSVSAVVHYVQQGQPVPNVYQPLAMLQVKRRDLTFLILLIGLIATLGVIRVFMS